MYRTEGAGQDQDNGKVNCILLRASLLEALLDGEYQVLTTAKQFLQYFMGSSHVRDAKPCKLQNIIDL